MKTSEMKDLILDWAVATANGDTFTLAHQDWAWYSSDWSVAGPIIEREGIGVYRFRGAWAAHCPLPNGGLHACMGNQPTPLIAAMRCYVASKLGDDIEIPEELTKGESK
jgi:hypothetical protein